MSRFHTPPNAFYCKFISKRTASLLKNYYIKKVIPYHKVCITLSGFVYILFRK